ncbi:hypothetical protein GCM10027168_64230 [Streptomyces capparidis]
MTDPAEQGPEKAGPLTKDEPAHGVPPERDAPARHGPAAEHAPIASPRFWSARRVPSAVVALLLLAAAGLLLYDTVAVEAADRRAGRWRRELADQLAARQLDDAWVLAVAAVAVLAGLLLLCLALTPGRRAVLPMAAPGPDLRAGLDRRAAALALRDGALRVAGVRAVRVKVGRRRARMRADVHFRDVAEVREELENVLADDIAGLGLVRPPRVSLTLREVNGA